MDFSSTFHHSTYNPILLLMLGVVGAVGVAVVSRWLSRSAGLTAAAVVALLLLVLAGEHIPLVAFLASKTFCFGDIGVFHIVAFVLPFLAAVLTFRRSTVDVAS